MRRWRGWVRAFEEPRSVSVWALSPDALPECLDLLDALERLIAAKKLEAVREIDVRGVAVDRLSVEHRAAGERHLVGLAAEFEPRELKILGRRLFEAVAPEEAAAQAVAAWERAEERAFVGRDLRMCEVPGEDRVRLTGWLDRESAAQLRTALDLLCAPGSGADLRSPGQRRVDAVVEVCRIAMACGQLPDNGGDRPQLVVTVGLDTLRDQLGAATLDDGTR